MREERWYKMLILSTVFHIIFIVIFSVPIKRQYRRFVAPPSYSVNLVGDIGSGQAEEGKAEQGGGIKEVPQPKRVEKVEPTKKKEEKHPPVKKRPVLARKEKELRSITKSPAKEAKRPAKEEALSKEELERLSKRLKELRKKTDYLNITGAQGRGGGHGSGQGVSGLPVSSAGGGQTLDPVTQRYILDVWERIKEAWGIPGGISLKKDLETVVTIRIRKDGRIVDINIEKRSGNRVYDESIIRALRSVDPLPPIPSSLNMDNIEIGFRFLPGDLS